MTDEHFPNEGRDASKPDRVREIRKRLEAQAENADQILQQELARLIDTCRQYLLLVARSQIDPRLRGKLDASDIVQDALATAHQEVHAFKGASEGELRVWLRQIVFNKAAEVQRRYVGTAKRDVRREVPLPEGSWDVKQQPLVDRQPTPREGALRAEIVSAINQVLERLPPLDQRLIRLRSYELKTFAEIGQHLDMSADAARKAWCRAIERFRDEWQRRQK